MWGVLVGVFWVVLVIVMIVLMAVILLQEGKGGGLAEAFGGAGAETFGVKATGINRFTGIAGGLFLLLAVLINLGMKWDSETVVAQKEAAPAAPALPGGVEMPNITIPAPASNEGASDEGGSDGGDQGAGDEGTPADEN